jgi:tetratricopeptide (TPR) repeat protein
MALGFGAALASAGAAEVTEVQELLRHGQYEEAAREAKAGVASAPGNPEWSLLLGRALLTLGRYREADAALSEARARDSQNIRLLWLAHEAALDNGRTDEAAKRLEEIRRLVSNRPWSYRDAPSLVVFGRLALRMGADPKEVLDKLYAAALKDSPNLQEIHLARGELALEKHDFALAAAAFQEGLKHFPDDPDLQHGLAVAYESGDRPAMLGALAAALKTNPRHVPSLLFTAEHQIDAEDYSDALETLDRIKAINPWHPDAWAYRAVVAHVRNDPDREKIARETALRFWPTNPRVDYLIGKKLAQKYRFAEAAAAQRRALEFDPENVQAKAELATDLLRLGQEGEGWDLAQEVHEKDAYDVEAYNLVTLHDTLAKYATLQDGDFVLRMTEHEAAVYGPRALALLKRARRQLTEKYGVELARPTYVEIFGDPKDFAVRTFGMPDIGGFLGVCFGRVVTANGPAANGGQAANWESVLWHEFCHVVTLQLTANRMPRWLSEGISVYEERQADASWGMRLNPRYRELVLGKEFTPVSKLSAAFLSPPTPEHLQFAYYESSLVVEFLVERFGLDSLKAILRDLRDGREINEAIGAHTEPMETFEREFTAYARSRAEKLAPGLDWEKPSPDLLMPGAEAEFAAWTAKHRDNYWALGAEAHRLVADKKWTEARPVLEHLVALFPRDPSPDGGYVLLARVHRALGEKAAEKKALLAAASLQSDAVEVYARLIELAREDRDWPAVARNAERLLAVNPLVAPPYRALAEASAAQGQNDPAIAAYRTLLQLDPADPADVHYQLARLLRETGSPEARRQTLQALEEAPRFRGALKLLLEIDEGAASAIAPPAGLPPLPPKTDSSSRP